MRPKAAAVVALALAAGCSQFNMAPACRETADGVRGTLLGGLADGETLDHARLYGIVAVSEPVEIGSGYNERTCTARAAVRGEAPLMLTYRVQQSEGLQNWYGVEFLDAGDQALHELAGRVRSLYLKG